MENTLLVNIFKSSYKIHSFYILSNWNLWETHSKYRIHYRRSIIDIIKPKSVLGKETSSLFFGTVHVDAVAVAHHDRTTGDRGVQAFLTAAHNERVVIELDRFTGPVETAGDAHIDRFAVPGERCPQVLGRRGTRQVADKHRWTASDARRKEEPWTVWSLRWSSTYAGGCVFGAVNASCWTTTEATSANDRNAVNSNANDWTKRSVVAIASYWPDSVRRQRRRGHCSEPRIRARGHRRSLISFRCPCWCRCCSPFSDCSAMPPNWPAFLPSRAGTALPKSRPPVYRCGRIRSGGHRFLHYWISARNTQRSEYYNSV